MVNKEYVFLFYLLKKKKKVVAGNPVSILILELM